MEEGELSFSDEVIAAVDKGRKIEAIKILRAETGLDLKDAKHAIDALVRKRRGASPILPDMAEDGGAGGLIKLLVVIALLLAAYSYFFAT